MSMIKWGLMLGLAGATLLQMAEASPQQEQAHKNEHEKEPQEEEFSSDLTAREVRLIKLGRKTPTKRRKDFVNVMEEGAQIAEEDEEDEDDNRKQKPETPKEDQKARPQVERPKGLNDWEWEIVQKLRGYGEDAQREAVLMLQDWIKEIPLDTDSSVTDLFKGVIRKDASAVDSKFDRDSLIARGSKAAQELSAITLDMKADRSTRILALSFLAETAPNKSSETIAKLLTGDDVHIQVEAVRAIARIKAEDLLPNLVKLARDEKSPEVQRASWQALLILNETQVGATPLADLYRKDLAHEKPAYRWEAARALGEMRDVKSLSTLSETLRNDKHERVRARAAQALAKIGSQDSIPALISALSDDHYEVADSALGALRSMTQQEFSNDPGKWQEWYQQNKKPAQAPK